MDAFKEVIGRGSARQRQWNEAEAVRIAEREQASLRRELANKFEYAAAYEDQLADDAGLVLSGDLSKKDDRKLKAAWLDRLEVLAAFLRDRDWDRHLETDAARNS